jgi:DNA-directed RNA polymerase specialized sigma24 family protein
MEPEQRRELAKVFDRWKRGDAAARGELIGFVYENYRGLAQRQLFPYRDLINTTESVLNQMAVRLLEKLNEERTPSLAAFLAYSAGQVRFALMDLVKEHLKHRGGGADLVGDVPEGATGPSELLAHTELHERAAALPDEERSLFDQHYYCGLTLLECADVLGLGHETVKKRWAKVRRKLGGALQT